jgi:hypothetical protein
MAPQRREGGLQSHRLQLQQGEAGFVTLPVIRAVMIGISKFFPARFPGDS